ncbi:two-component sensor histidine kinase [Colwellia sp. 75C3]|uniref:sensor histidine kinase n=1 Tax=Colwellia sp. 75C3 TaxID=888425 RepID=UPI000C3300C9|nr:HAMP domain-containing sensor histidine kinase [Colwellia sp. 75C3]PKG82482.1 two-component sensor histidine kinase [Colwellia sp. 75C3]
MKISLYQRLALTLCAAFIIMASLLVAWSNSLVEQSKYQAEQKLHVNLAEHLAHDNPLLQDGVYDKPALENLFHTLMLLGPAFEFYFLDAEGNILTYSADPAKIKRKAVSLAPLKQLIANPQQVPVFGDDPRGFSNKKIFSASPVYQGDLLQGYLYIIIGGEIYDSIFSQVQGDKDLQKYGAFVIASLLLLLLVLLAVFHYFTHPVRELARQMQALKAVQYDQTKIQLKQWGSVSDHSIDNNEVHFLGATFNDMVVQINQQFSLLTENDRIRRELLAHLSHDLRTPLATMQGYVETLVIKADSITDIERAQYLVTVQRSIAQLKRLIDQIFELAHLENGQVTVNLETFAIGELLHDIMAKFVLKADEKKISLALKPAQCRFMVYSDIAKLERIMTNLLENAIRHTNEGGEIIINVSQGDNKQNNKIKIAVIDNGSGISKADIAYIFDARYRASNAIEDSTHHTGLGLAISQKLSLILNSELMVSSELGQGSNFSFSLKTA